MHTTVRCTVLAIAMIIGVAAAHATDLVAKKLTFDPLPRVDRAGRIGLEVTNSGTRASGAFSVKFTIRFQDNVVYEQTVSASSILAEGSANVWTPYTFIPRSQGIHDATAEVLYSTETDNTDNTVVGTCNPLSGYIRRDTAIARLQVRLAPIPQRTPLAAFHLPLTSGRDSVHEAGTTITFMDGSAEVLTVPSYVFFVDHEPTTFYGHSTRAVLIPAERTSKDPIVERTTNVPFAINGVPIDPGSWCGANPNRVIGDSGSCTDVTPSTTNVTQNTATCVLIFTGAAIRDIDDVTMRHDIARYVNRLNSDPSGPNISFGSFRVRRGTALAGMTRQQLADEFGVFKSSGCQKLVIKYIGHSTTDGLLLAGSVFNGMEVLPWNELADMLDSLDAADITVDITSNYAGRLATVLRSKAVLGTCIVSADADSTMLTGHGVGTYWERAQRDAVASSTADTDGDGVTDVTEAARWVVTNLPSDDSARRPLPSVIDLDSPGRIAASDLDGFTDEAWNIPGGTGSLTVSMERYRVLTSYRDGSTRRDLLVDGGTLYIDNATTSTVRADAIYEFIVLRGRGADRQDSVVARLRPEVGPESRIRVATIPAGWTTLIVRKAPTSGPTVIIDSGQVVDRILKKLVATHPKRYRSTIELTDRGDGRIYDVSTIVSGAVNNDIVAPGTVTTNALYPSRITVTGSLRQDRLSGGAYSMTLTDRSSNGRTIVNAVMLQPISADSQSALKPMLSWYDATVTSGTHTVSSLNRSFVRLSATASIIPDQQRLQVFGSVIESPTISTRPLHWGSEQAGIMEIGGLMVSGIAKLSITHRDLTVRTMRMGDVSLTLKPLPGKHDVRFIGLYGSRGDALTVDLSGEVTSYTIRGLDVVEPDNFDVRLTGGGILHCVDCNISLQNSIASGGSALHLRQTVSAIVTDAEGNPKKGAVVDVVGRTGTVLATGVTDEQGFVVIDTVLIGSTTTKVVDHRPIAIRLTNGDGATQTETVSTSHWTQVMFRDSSTVGVDEEHPHPTAVMPMPVTTSSAAVVADDRGILGIELLTVAGERVFRQQGTGEPRLPLNLYGMTPGMYVLTVTTPTGSSTMPLIIQ